MTGKGYAYLATEIVGAETIEDPLAFPAAEGYLGTMPSADSTSSYIVFRDKFQQAYGRIPDRWAGFSYDMVLVLAEGIRGQIYERSRRAQRIAGEDHPTRSLPDGTSLMRVLREVRLTRGATGDLSFSPATNDRSDMPYDIFNLQGRQMVTVGTTYPSGTFDTRGRPPIILPG